MEVLAEGGVFGVGGFEGLAEGRGSDGRRSDVVGDGSRVDLDLDVVEDYG